MPIKSKVFIQTLQKSQDRHKISFAFDINDKNTKKVFGANLPPCNTIKLDLPPNTIRVKIKCVLYSFSVANKRDKNSRSHTIKRTCLGHLNDFLNIKL